MQKLYLIECQGFLKIGVAYDVLRRVAELSTGNPFELKVLAIYGYENAQVVEGSLHQRFSTKQVRGEWFSLDENDVRDFHTLCRGLGGMMLPVPSVIDDDVIEESEDEAIVAQEQTMINKEDRNLRILELYRENMSQRQIEQGVFGYTGGYAATIVSNVIKKHKTSDTK